MKSQAETEADADADAASYRLSDGASTSENWRNFSI